MSTHKPTLEGPLAITMAVGENVTYVTTIVSKIDAKAVILQESCLLMLEHVSTHVYSHVYIWLHTGSNTCLHTCFALMLTHTFTNMVCLQISTHIFANIFTHMLTCK